MTTRYVIKLVTKDGVSASPRVRLPWATPSTEAVAASSAEHDSSFEYPLTSLPQTVTDTGGTSIPFDRWPSIDASWWRAGLSWWEVSRADLDATLLSSRLAKRIDRFLQLAAGFWLQPYKLDIAIDPDDGSYGPIPSVPGEPIRRAVCADPRWSPTPRILVGTIDDADVHMRAQQGNLPELGPVITKAVDVVWCSISDTSAESQIGDAEDDYADFLTAVAGYAGGGGGPTYDAVCDAWAWLVRDGGPALSYRYRVRNAALTWLTANLP
ncbi:MAG: hypothetical protein SFX73_38540 [Kofleriaceae bacterium]|nr:hypothetical protein [Kofleriaceae bacterium]